MLLKHTQTERPLSLLASSPFSWHCYYPIPICPWSATFWYLRAQRDEWSIRQEILIKSTIIVSSFLKWGSKTWERVTTHINIKEGGIWSQFRSKFQTSFYRCSPQKMKLVRFHPWFSTTHFKRYKLILLRKYFIDYLEVLNTNEI